MKIIATEDLDLFGTHYRRGETLDISVEAASRLLRDRKANITAAEVMLHLKGKRLFTQTTAARDMVVRRG